MFEELTLIIAIATAVSLVMRFLKQPMMIGYILAGVIVGPTVLNIDTSTDTLHTFGEFGVALLLFIMGLNLNIKVIREIGKVALLASLSQVAIVGGITFAVATVMGYSQTVALYIAVALSLSSTIIVIKLLSDKKEQSRLYAKISVGFLIIQDFLATIAVLFVASSNGGNIEVKQFMLLASKGAVLLGSMLIFRYMILPHMNKLVARSQEFLFLFAISMALGIATLSKIAGFSLEIGALLAGMTLASMPYAIEISSRLKPLRDFFLVLHFIILGSMVDPNVISSSPIKTVVFSLIVLIFNPIAILIIMGLMGYTRKTSFKAGLAMTQVGEFSLILLVLANHHNYIDSATVSLITSVALITIAISTYMIIYSENLYNLTEKHLKLFERRKAKELNERRRRYDLVLFGYQRGGHEFLSTFKKISKKFIVVDYDPNVIDFLEQKQIDYIYGDATDIDLLEEINLKHSKMVVSMISDLGTNKGLASWLQDNNPHCVIIVSADNAEEASELYKLGVSYVILPHYIGSEKISSFIKKSELNKTAFKQYRERHLNYLQTHSSELIESVE